MNAGMEFAHKFAHAYAAACKVHLVSGLQAALPRAEAAADRL